MEGLSANLSSLPEDEGSFEQANRSVLVMPWIDEVVETHGFAPRSMYVEMCWLPLLGPTTTLLYRRLGSWAEHNPDGVTIDLGQLAVGLGLGMKLGRHSQLMRSLDRLDRFGAMRRSGAELQVRRALPPLTELQARRLDEVTRRLHREYTRRPRPTLPGSPA